MSSNIIYPFAEDLDSGDWAENSGWRCNVYLVPAAETDNGIPVITTHSGLGNIGTPEPAFHHRWKCIGSYGPKTVGESVLDALIEHEDVLLDLSARYLGATWDGNNMRGSWSQDDDEAAVIEHDDLRVYWDAWDWFGPASIGWEELCAEAGVNPRDALDEEWTDVADRVAAIVGPEQDQHISRTDEYARQQAEEYRREAIDALYDDQIEALRSEARAAGDAVQDAICALALGRPYGVDDHCLDLADWRRVERMTRDDARAICAGVIAYAADEGARP